MKLATLGAFMPHEFSLAHLSALALSPPQLVEAAARAGYDFIGLRARPVTSNEPTYPLTHDGALLNETRARLADSNIAVLDIELARLTPEVNVTDFEALLDLGAELGARHVIAQGADADFQRVVDHYAQLCDLARSRNLSVDLEPVTWTETATLARAARIVDAADRSNGGILIDTLHFSRSGCSIEALGMLPRRWFRYAQVCDAPKEPPDTVDGLIHAARNDRQFLGEGGLNLAGILGALPATIPYSLEIPNVALTRQLGIEEYIRRALTAARAFVERSDGTSDRIGRSSSVTETYRQA